MSKVYFIGAGPGNPDNLTLRGARALEGCSAVFAPSPYEETFAAFLAGKDLLVPFEYDFGELLDLIERRLLEGDVGFLVPGDLTFYSPFQSLIDALGERAVVVPGVGIANAASGLLKRTLDLPGLCNRAILVSPRTLGDDEDAPALRDLAKPGATLVIYMNNLPLAELVSELRAGYGSDVPIALLHRLDLPGEAVVTGTLDTIVDEAGERDFFNLGESSGRPALTLVIVGSTLDAEVDGSWWDYRREHIWKHRQ